MKVYLNSISGIPDAITSMFISKRHIDREKEEDIINLCEKFTDRNGFYIPSCINEINNIYESNDDRERFDDMLNKVCNWGKTHTTLLRFIDLSFSVYGLHRGGQDDWDSHTCRFNNRIIRSSTRLATFEDEMSDYYKDKIITMDQAIDLINIDLPNTVTKDGIAYIKTTNGYIREEYKDNKDVKRGLYMLSIPSNFIFRVNLTEFAHVYKERKSNSTANPEVKELCESCADLLEIAHSQFTRYLFEQIKN